MQNNKCNNMQVNLPVKAPVFQKRKVCQSIKTDPQITDWILRVRKRDNGKRGRVEKK
jgi:hypothetical protein